MNETLNKKLIKWLDKMVKTYPNMYFKYSYSSERNIYFINIFNRQDYEIEDEYYKAENEFSYELSKSYPEDTVLFTFNEELFSPLEDSILIDKQIIIKTSEYSKSRLSALRMMLSLPEGYIYEE